MTKYIILICIIIVGIGYYNFKTYKDITSKKTELSPTPARNLPQGSADIKDKSIFVSYWADMDNLDLSDYQRAIYFGVAPTLSGINILDAGYAKLDDFVSAAGEKETWLTLRIVDTDLATTILENQAAWPRIAESTVKAATDNGFEGILIDLELGILPVGKAANQITGFTKYFADYTHQQDLKVGMAVYGDTYYRGRPYDLKEIQKDMDEMMIMAYDFHKAIGEPGPNFPLSGLDKYGYDFQIMIKDMLTEIPAKKISVIFGMYGYEWIVDEQKRPLKAATALSYKEIKKKYLNRCKDSTCLVRRDEESTETEINYVESVYKEDTKEYVSAPKIIWYEDMESVRRKSAYLQKMGINKISFWTYGYF